MKVLSTEKTRNVILRAEAGEVLPDGLARELRDQAVTCGWYRASGVLEDVELRASGAETNGSGASRKISGRVQVIALEGSVGISAGDVSFGMRAVLAREKDGGMETLAGEIVSARVVALEVLVAAFDDLAVPRSLDPLARVWIFGEPTSGSAASVAAPAPARAPVAVAPVPVAPAPVAPITVAPQRPAPAPAWNAPVAASELPPRPAPVAKPLPSGPGAAMPQRPVRAESTEEEQTLFPEAGDVVLHFAFGRCEVLKSDGDRLHLKVGKDSRVREIALEMLKVSALPEEEGKRTFKLERRL